MIEVGKSVSPSKPAIYILVLHNHVRVTTRTVLIEIAAAEGCSQGFFQYAGTWSLPHWYSLT